jgi:hypothetical protein
MPFSRIIAVFLREMDAASEALRNQELPPYGMIRQ